jgi:MFS family permease
LLGFRAIGEVASSLAAGSLVLPLTLGVLICLSQLLAGASLTIFLFPGGIVAAVLGVILFGVFSAPLTIWAQTLRMKIIPPTLRGRTFALLRMLMQSGNPIGGAIGGAILPIIGIPLTIALAALFAGVPGIIGLRVNALRKAGGAEHLELTSVQKPAA